MCALRSVMAIGILLCMTVEGKSQKMTPPSRHGNSLAYLRKMQGVGPWDLWKTQPIRRRLIALIGAKEFEALQTSMNPAEPLKLEGSLMYSVGLQEHMGGEEEGALIVDLDRDVMEVLLLHGGNRVLAWSEGGQIALPANMTERLKATWPQPQLRRALAALQKPDGNP